MENSTTVKVKPRSRSRGVTEKTARSKKLQSTPWWKNRFGSQKLQGKKKTTCGVKLQRVGSPKGTREQIITDRGRFHKKIKKGSIPLGERWEVRLVILPRAARERG